MVCDTFKVCQQVIVNETEVESAVAVTQSLDMAKFDLVAKVIYDLFERLDFFRHLNVVIRKGIDGQNNDLGQRRTDNTEVFLSGRGQVFSRSSLLRHLQC